jgi:hypothetical protein
MKLLHMRKHKNYQNLSENIREKDIGNETQSLALTQKDPALVLAELADSMPSRALVYYLSEKEFKEDECTSFWTIGWIF